MERILHALRVFFEQLAAVGWRALAIAFLFHVAKVVVRTRAWRNILLAAYPGVRLPWRTVLGAYVAGVGVNAITPARGGDVVKLYLVRRRLPGSAYPTLGATLVVETLFDFIVAGALFLWALEQGVLPGLDVVPRLPSVDWSWLLRHPRVAQIGGAVLLVALVVVGALAARKAIAFKRRVARGFAILGDRRRYVREVASWQALSWGFRLASVYWFLRAFGIEASLHNALLVQVVQSLSTLLPFTPGGIGTEQGLLVYVFGGKVTATHLLSFSVGVHVALVVVNVVLGAAALGLMLRTLRWRRLVGGGTSGREPVSD